MLLDKLKDDVAVGTPPAAEAAPAAKAVDEEFDDLGYKIEPDAKSDVKKEEPKPDPVGATGYDKEPEAPPKEEKDATGYIAKPDDKPPVEDPKKIEDGLDLKVDGLHELDAKEIKEFAIKHKVSKEVAQAMVDNKLADIKKINDFSEKRKAELVKEAKVREMQYRKASYDELMKDPTFGGDKFEFNVKRANKVIEDFLPNLKKQLTDTKGMLPPYVMRDIAKLADTLYGTEGLPQGESRTINKEQETKDDALDFYN